MMKKTHVAIGVLATSCLIIYTDLPRIPLICGIIGSTMPDLDFTLGIPHRTWTHSLIGMLVVVVVCSIINPVFGLSVCANYSTHIIADSMTKMGVPILYPTDKNYYGYRLFRTGKSEDMFICLIVIFILSEMFMKI